MRLLYVIHQFFPDCHSGTEQYCLAMAQEARRQGHEVTVLSLDWREDEHEPVRLFELPYDGFRVVRLAHWRRLNPNDVLRDYENRHLEGWFQAVLDDVRPDAVHFFHLRQLGSNLIPVARRAGLRTVVNLMDFWYLCPRFTLLRRDGSLCDGPPEGGMGCVACEHPELAGVAPAAAAATVAGSPPARLRALLDRKARQFANLLAADTIVSPSRFVQERLVANGFPAGRIDVVPYGLATGRIVPVPVQRPRTPLRLGFCGVLSPWKGARLCVQAVRGTRAAVELRVHGRLEEPAFADYIAALRADADGDPRITLAGAYAAKDAAAVFAAMDVLVVPSTWYENTPFVVLEAFAAGVAVIASDLGGLREVVEDGRNGRLFAAGDVGSLRAVIEQVAADPNWFAGLRITPPNDIGRDFARFAAAYRGAP